jgi:hypothetical protein
MVVDRSTSKPASNATGCSALGDTTATAMSALQQSL